MNDTPTQIDEVPEALPEPRRRWWSAAQAIWLIPLVALLVVGWLGAADWLERGPTITIRFRSGEGIEAGKTRIKYRDVDIGEVTRVRLAPDLKGVLVKARMSRDASALLVDDTRFWVVRARITGSEVSGLATLLSGAYIGIDGGKSEEARRDFEGLETQPVVAGDDSGREFLLRADSLGSLDIGSAVFFRGVRVGQVLSTDLDKDGGKLLLRVFVREPYDRYVNVNTRFWHASGLDVSVDAGGLRLRTESLLSVLVGGVAFETPADLEGGAPAPPQLSFTLFDSQPTAMRRASWQMMDYKATFTDSVRGLAVGAPVEFKGFVIGEVASVNIAYDRHARRFVFPVQLRIYRDIAATVTTPDSVRRGTAASTPAGRFPLEELLSPQSVARGLRAQLRTANLLSGQRYVAIDFFPDQRAAEVGALNGNAREIPTARDSFSELEATIERIAKRLEAVPFEQISAELRQTLQGVESAANSFEKTMQGVNQELLPGMRETLGDTRAAMQDVRALIAQDAPLSQDLRAALQDLSRAADAMRQLAETLERQPESLLRGKRSAVEAPR